MEVVISLGGDHLTLRPETEFETEFIDKHFHSDVIVARKSGSELQFKFSTSRIIWDQEKE